MHHHAAIRHLLYEYEVELMQASTRANESRLRQLLASDFYEIGSSGRCYDFKTTLTHIGTYDVVVSLPLAEFQCELLGEGLAIVHYNSIAHYGLDTKHTRRTSLWVNTPLGWQMRFHQGTPYSPL